MPCLWHFLVLGGDCWGSKAPPSIALPVFSRGPKKKGIGPSGSCAPSSRYPLSRSYPCTWLPSPSSTPVFRGLRGLSTPIWDYLAFQRLHPQPPPASPAGGQSGNTSLPMSRCANLILSAGGGGEGGRTSPSTSTYLFPVCSALGLLLSIYFTQSFCQTPYKSEILIPIPQDEESEAQRG